jgi:hypothetical protein
VPHSRTTKPRYAHATASHALVHFVRVRLPLSLHQASLRDAGVQDSSERTTVVLTPQCIVLAPQFTASGSCHAYCSDPAVRMPLLPLCCLPVLSVDVGRQHSMCYRQLHSQPPAAAVLPVVWTHASADRPADHRVWLLPHQPGCCCCGVTPFARCRQCAGAGGCSGRRAVLVWVGVVIAAGVVAPAPSMQQLRASVAWLSCLTP